MKQIDKILHALVCMVLMVIFAKWFVPFPLAIFFVVCIAVGKEVVDYIRYRHFCWYDILADMVGLGVGIWVSVCYTGVCNWGID